MSEPTELAAVLARTHAVRVIEAHAQALGCRLAVFGSDPAPLTCGDGLDAVRLEGHNGSERATGVPGAWALAPIEAFGRRMGCVVAVAPDGVAPRPVAERAADVLADLCSREYELNDLSREILAAYEELNLFYDLADRLAGAPDPPAICGAVLERAMHVIRAHAGRILIKRRWGAGMDVAAARGAPAADAEPASPDASAAARSVERREAELVEGRSQLSESELDEWERSAATALITVPLYLHGHDDRTALGVLQLRDPQPGGSAANGDEGRFTSGDVKLAQALASQAALLIENSRLVGFERELQIARRIQEGLLPTEPPDIGGLDVAARCVPAHNVGGDYFDLVRSGKTGMDVVLADVSGHHLAAALIQTAARATFRTTFLESDSPQAILDRVNRALMDDLTRSELFLTAWYARVDGATGEVVYSDAGHHPALYFSVATGAVQPLEMGGLPIGVADDGMFRDHRVVLAPGDVIVTYTDGLSEAQGGGGVADLYGDERVAECLARSVSESAEEILTALLDDVDAFSAAKGTDDRTVVVLKRREDGSR